MSIHFTIPAAAFISANDRLHWTQRRAKTKTIRQTAAIAARRHQPITTPVLIAATIHRPKNGRLADADNAAPTIKAAIDGCRDAGVLAEDNREHVTAVAYRIAPGNRADTRYGIELAFIDQEVPF